MDYIHTFNFDGHEIRVNTQDLPSRSEITLDSLFSSGDSNDRTLTGAAEDTVVRDAITSLYIDGKQHPVVKRNHAGVEENDIPPYRDREKRISLFKALLRVCVEDNDWLGFWEPYNSVFAKYLPEADKKNNEEPKENPTSLPAG